MNQKLSTKGISNILAIVFGLFGIGLITWAIWYVSKPHPEDIKPPEEKVIVTTDTAEYQKGESVKIFIENNLAYPIFLGGCNEYGLDIKENGQWKEEPPLKQCVWEGFGIKINSKETASYGMDASKEGTFRISIGYSKGCEDHKPLSQANCQTSEVAHSSEFTVTKNNPVSMFTDKTEYEQGEGVVLKIKNNTGYERFIVFPAIERFENNGWLPIKFIWSGCGVAGGLQYLPLEGNKEFSYSWDQKEKWCTENPASVETYSKDAIPGKYRIKSETVQRTKSENEDPVNLSGKPTGKYIYSNEFVIKEKPAELSFETVLKGTYNEYNKKSETENILITSQADWLLMLQKVGLEFSGVIAPVDFAKDMLIASFQGLRATGGYGIEIIKITETANNLEVYIKDVSPGPGCIVTQALTSPYHIVKLQKSDKEAVFKIEKTVNNCQ